MKSLNDSLWLPWSIIISTGISPIPRRLASSWVIDEAVSVKTVILSVDIIYIISNKGWFVKMLKWFI